jgi:uncharacterized membrane protein HdeD (DUF308 family)
VTSDPESRGFGGSIRRRDEVGRASQVVLGLLSVAVSVEILAVPPLSVGSLLVVLAVAVGLTAAQTVLAGGRLLTAVVGDRAGDPLGWRLLQSWWILGVGLLAIALAVVAAVDPMLVATAAVFLLAVALVSQGLGRVARGGGVNVPLWLRGSSIGTGVITVALVVLSVAFEGYALPGFAILVGLILLISGIETIVAGLHPTDPRQFVLLKLILFSALYGLVLINWIDLFGKSVPGYGIWLLLTYMAPFGVLIVFEGWESWPLATSLGLLVSLMNDVGYFFVGNLLFGFHVALGPWIAGQLGFRGSFIVTTFEGGFFSLDVPSWMMGLSIYARAAVVGVILYYWWRHPSRLIARIDTPAPGEPA